MRFSSPAIVTPVDANVTQWRGVVPAALEASFVQTNVRNWLSVTADALSTLKDQVSGANGPALYPAGPGLGTAVASSASANVFGAWVEFDASAASDRIIHGVSIDRNAAGGEPEYVGVDVGVGAGGSEVSIGETRLEREAGVVNLRNAEYLPFEVGLKVSTGERVSARTSDNKATPAGHVITLHYVLAGDLEAFDA